MFSEGVKKREVLLIGLNLLAIANPSLETSALACLALLVHILTWKRTRWQLYPSHVAQTLAFVLALSPRWSVYLPNWLSITVQVIASILVVVALLLLYLVPMRSPISTRGPYKVGVRVLYVNGDEDSAKVYAPRGTTKRCLEYNIRVFFPTDKSSRVRLTPYLTHGVDSATAFANFANLPKFLMSHMSQMRIPVSRSTRPAGVSAYPVVIFSHGLGGTPDVYAGWIHDMVSHGYIVAAVEHNDYSQAMIKLPNGHVNWYRRLADLKNLEEDCVTPSSKERTEFDVRNSQLKHRVREMQYTLDILQYYNSSDVNHSDPLFGRMDLSRVIAAGHSFGGATATQTAYFDKRFHACLNLDGWQLPLDEEVKCEGLPVPAFFMESYGFQLWKTNYESMQRLFTASHGSSVFLTLKDSGHQNFSDFPILAPLMTRKMKVAGKRDGRETLQLVVDYCVAFLQSVLQGEPSKLLVAPLHSDTDGRRNDARRPVVWEPRSD